MLDLQVAVDNVGLSFLHPPGAWRSSNTNLSGARPKKMCAFMEVEDLSAGYNTYRCLSPHEPPAARVAVLAPTGRGLLRRQYSLDRGDDPAGSSASGHAPAVPMGRGLYKQNSAGAAHDLQRIEEAPGDVRDRMTSAYLARTRELASVSSKSVSAESLGNEVK